MVRVVEESQRWLEQKKLTLFFCEPPVCGSRARSGRTEANARQLRLIRASRLFARLAWSTSRAGVKIIFLAFQISRIFPRE